VVEEREENSLGKIPYFSNGRNWKEQWAALSISCEPQDRDLER